MHQHPLSIIQQAATLPLHQNLSYQRVHGYSTFVTMYKSELSCGKLEFLQQAFWKYKRGDNHSYYLKVDKLIEEAWEVEDWQPIRCKYCKAMPFNLTQTFKPAEVGECSLCASINDYPMKHQLFAEVQQTTWYSNYSYICPVKEQAAPDFTCILLIDASISQENFAMLGHSLTQLLPSQLFKIAVLFVVNGQTVIVNFENQPCLVYLTRDIEMKPMIEQYSKQLGELQMESLKDIFQTLKEQTQKQSRSYQKVRLLLENYNQIAKGKLNMLVWIGNMPINFLPMPSTTVYTIAVLMNSQKSTLINQQIQLNLQFSELHLISSEDQAIQLYYKCYEIFAEDRYNYLITSQMIVKTNHQYSGSFKTYVKGIVNNRSPILQIEASKDRPHKLQIMFDYYDVKKGMNFHLCINLQEKKKTKSLKLLDRWSFLNKSLKFLLQKYSAVKSTPQREKINKQFDFWFISSQLKEFGDLYENKTEENQNAIAHLINYFKQFQKEPSKLYIPFDLIDRLPLLIVFHPIRTKSDLIHYYSCYYTDDEAQEKLEQVNTRLQLLYTPRDKKLPIFYRICIDEGEEFQLGLTQSQE